MIRHYFLMALLKFRLAPVTTLANVVTLALGLFAVIIASGIVSYWRSSDSDIAPLGRAIALTTAYQDEDSPTAEMVATPAHLAKYVRQDIPRLEDVARFRLVGDIPADTGDHIVILKGAQAEPDLLNVFHFRFISGNPKTALDPDSAVILTQSAAERLFGDAPAVGRRLVLARQRDVVVTGVIAPPAEPSVFANGPLSFDYLSVMPPDPPGQAENWGNMSLQTFGLLPADGSLTIGGLNRQLAAMAARRIPPERKDDHAVFRAAPVQEITERNLNVELFGYGNTRFSVVSILFGLGLIVLCVACLNYANLATAQAASRAKEIGMRKVLGASRMGVLVQSWVEAGVSILAALALTVLMVWLVAPAFKAQMDIDIARALLRDPVALAAIAGLSAATALVAGLYPAFFLTSVRPAEALGAGKLRGGPRVIAEILIGIQFAAAGALLIAVFIVNQQNNHLRGLALKRSADPVLALPPVSLTGVDINTLRQELTRYPQVKAVGEVIALPWSPSESLSPLSRSPEPLVSRIKSSILRVGLGYFEASSSMLLAGRIFDDRDKGAAPLFGGKHPASSPGRDVPIVIDRLEAQRLGFPSPTAAVGQHLYFGSGVLEIIGVVENQPRRLKGEAGLGTAYTYVERAEQRPLIRISANDVDGGLAAVKQTWSKVAPNMPLTYEFTDEVFEQNFKGFARVGQLFQILSLLALLISAAGLFGMAVHVIQRRMHEIGVRKTLGSSATGLVGLLLASFSKPVIVANLLAWPAAWYAAQAYLGVFAERITISPLPFVVSLSITLLIAWLAVGGQTLRAALVCPAEVLRHA
jgi:putative ABC transport system permease protein